MVLIRSEPDSADVQEPAPPFPILAATNPTPVSGSIVVNDPEYISIEEIQRLRQQRSVPLVIVDSRSERTYEESTEAIPGAIRLHPDRAVQAAKQHRIAKGDVLAVLCA
jgi:hypothetical protein